MFLFTTGNLYYKHLHSQSVGINVLAINLIYKTYQTSLRECNLYYKNVKGEKAGSKVQWQALMATENILTL